MPVMAFMEPVVLQSLLMKPTVVKSFVLKPLVLELRSLEILMVGPVTMVFTPLYLLPTPSPSGHGLVSYEELPGIRFKGGR